MPKIWFPPPKKNQHKTGHDSTTPLGPMSGVLGTIADEIQLQQGTFLEFISDEVRIRQTEICVCFFF